MTSPEQDGQADQLGSAAYADAGQFAFAALVDGPVGALGGYFIGKSINAYVASSPSAQDAIKEAGLLGVSALSSDSYAQNKEDVGNTGNYSEGGNLLTAAGTLLNISSVRKLLGDARTPEVMVETPPSGTSYSDILSPADRQHILYGDSPTSGGHYPPGNPGTFFQASMSPDQVIHDVGDIVTAPNTKWYAQTGTGGQFTANGNPANWVAWEVRDGVQMRVVYQPATGRVVSACPDVNGPSPGLKPITNGK